MIQPDATGFIIAGSAGSNDGNVSVLHGYVDCWIIKIDTSGILKWERSYGGSKRDEPISIIKTIDRGLAIAGYTFSIDGDVSGNHDAFGNYADAWIVKLSPQVGINELSENKNSLIIYPTPLTSSSTLHFTTPLKDAEVIIYDMLGHEMMKKKMNGDRMEIERGSLVSGVYFVKVSTDEKQWVEKIIVE